MKKTLTVILLFINLAGRGQVIISSSPEARDLYSKARYYLQKTDYANAIMVYNQAINVDPANLLFRRELAHAYLMQGDVVKGEKMITPLLKSNEADEETFQVASRIYRAMKKTEDAESAINKGISKFPQSGVLYAEKGELYTQEKKYKSASLAWESGIEHAPAFRTNYYNLAKVYFFTKNYLWAIVYGESFVNMESFSSKTEEIKKIVFESYKFLIADLSNTALDGKINRYENPQSFEEACLKIFDNIRTIVTGGANADNLAQLRTRFLIEWNRSFAREYPLELFDYQQQLLLHGYFDTYNQWLFGKLDNEVLFRQWTQKYASAMNSFDIYFRNNKLVPKLNQYYHFN
jgi:tetratricopeptide (TPR) repeat protein